jgi:hypothetical protein
MTVTDMNDEKFQEGASKLLLNALDAVTKKEAYGLTVVLITDKSTSHGALTRNYGALTPLIGGTMQAILGIFTKVGMPMLGEVKDLDKEDKDS